MNITKKINKEHYLDIKQAIQTFDDKFDGGFVRNSMKFTESE